MEDEKLNGVAGALSADAVAGAVYAAVRHCATHLRPDVLAAMQAARADETQARALSVLDCLLENAHIGQTDGVPICQDTGTCWVRLEIGEELSVPGNILSRVNDAVARAYTDGRLRMSVLADALLDRPNTGDNTPAVIASTASPYKFPDSVLDAFDCEKPADPFAEAELLAKLSNTKIPAPITALRTKPVRFENTCAAADMADFVRETVRV